MQKLLGVAPSATSDAATKTYVDSKQPMTTVDDIIVGGASGVPTRKAKGSNSRVFGVDSSGNLGYYQVTDAMTSFTALNVNTSGAGTGEIKASSNILSGGGFYPNAQSSIGFDGPVSHVTLAATTSLQISGQDFATVFIIDKSFGLAAIFSTQGNFNLTELLVGSSTYWTVSAGAGSKISCFYSGGLYYIHNGHAAGHTLSVARIKM